VPSTCALQLQSAPEVLIAGVNAALASLHMGLYHMEDMVGYVWSFLTPRVRDHMCMVLAACQFQMTAAGQPCSHVEEVEPMIPTMKEVRGGDTKVHVAEGFFMPVKKGCRGCGAACSLSCRDE